MKRLYYILDENNQVVDVNGVVEAYKWRDEDGKNRWKIANTNIKDGEETINISTVFLTINHAWGPNEEPVLFETMVFGGAHDQWQDRYTTHAEAKKGHRAAIRMVRGGMTSKIMYSR